jgi:uncharacterized protein
MYPLFGMLFGYGLVRLAARPGGGTARVRRRGRWLLVIGFGHAALLFSGDIVGAYGLLGLLLGARVVTAAPGRLLRAAGVGLLGPALAGVVLAAPVLPGQRVWLLWMTASDRRWLCGWRSGSRSASCRPSGSPRPCSSGPGRPGAACPTSQRRTLVRVACVGLAVDVAGVVPLALMAAGLVPWPSACWTCSCMSPPSRVTLDRLPCVVLSLAPRPRRHVRPDRGSRSTGDRPASGRGSAVSRRRQSPRPPHRTAARYPGERRR